jgi:PPOX class probable FMN-dependent enzyme
LGGGLMADHPERPAFDDVVASADDVAAMYGSPVKAVVSKVIDHLDGHCRDFIARSPFVLVATADENGNVDVSPKGGAPGFVTVLDEKRLAIPDAPGNRLVYSLRNIVAKGRAGLLFLIPGLEETLRVNGRAWLTRDHAVLEQLAGDDKLPKVAIGVEVEEAFLHCAKAFKRSALWRPAEWPDTAGLAAAAQIWRDHMALDMTTQEIQEFVDDDYANNLTWR